MSTTSVLAAAALLLTAFCLSVVCVGLWLSWPARATIGPAPADLPGAQSVDIPSASGSRLSGWFEPGKPGGGAIVLLHGVRSNRRSLIARARHLHANGFSVLLFDFQAHGESPGGTITFGKLEALDAAAAVRFLGERLPSERIGAIGSSLGGAASLLGPHPLPVHALVLESVYPDMDAALRNRLRHALGPFLGSVLTPLLASAFNILLPPLIGVRPDELRPIDHIADIRAPLLILSGTADPHTLIAETQTLFDRANEPKTLYGVAGAGHVDLEHFDSSGYWQIVLPFLAGHLRQERNSTARDRSD